MSEISKSTLFEAQKLLVDLSRAFAANQSVSKSRRSFFEAPPELPPISLLQTLQGAQREVKRLVEALEGSGERSAAAASPASSSNVAQLSLAAVHQVLSAIQALMPHEHLMKPDRERILAAIRSVKPAIDRLVEVLAAEETDPDKERPKERRRPIPPNPRGSLLNRLVRKTLQF